MIQKLFLFVLSLLFNFFPNKKPLFLVFLFITLGLGSGYGATITSTATGGNWSNTTTWVGGIVPANGDTVIIATTGAGAVDISATITQIAAGSVTINSGATLTTSNGVITFGALTINNGGVFNCSRVLNILGVTTITGTINFITTSNTNSYSGDITLNNGAVWNEAVINNSSIGGNFTNNATTFTALGGIYTFSGSGKIFSGSTTTIIPVVQITGTYTNNGVLSNSTVLSGSGSLTNASGSTFTIGGMSNITTLANAGTLNISGSGAITTALANFTNTGTLNLNGSGNISGITNNAGGTVNLASSGTITAFDNATATSVLQITAASANITTLTATAAGNTVNYNGISQTINGTTYSNLILSNSGTKALGAAITTTGALTLNNDTSLAMSTFLLTLNGNLVNSGAGSITGTTGGVIIGGTATQSIAGFTTTGLVSMTKTAGTATFTSAVNGGGLTINGSGGTLNLGAGLTHIFTGNWTRTNGTLNGGSAILKIAGDVSGTGGTFTANTGTVEFNKAGNQSLGTGALTYNNLVLSGSGTKTLGAIATVSGNWSMISGTLANLGALTHTAGTLVLGGAGPLLSSWGSTTSGATNTTNDYFTGTGRINVSSAPYPAIDNNYASYTSGVTGQVAGTQGEYSNPPTNTLPGSLTLSAPAGSAFVNVKFASYGSPGGTSPNFTIGSCHAFNSRTVTTGLLGQNIATIPASGSFNATFGDPCYGIVKSYNVVATYAEPFCSTSGVPAIVINGSTPTGGNGTYTYLWEKSTTGHSTGYAPASGTNDAVSYTVPAGTSQTTWYRRTVTSGIYSDATIVIVQVVTGPPTVPTTFTSSASCAGTTTLSVSGGALGGVGGYVEFATGSCGGTVVGTSNSIPATLVVSPTTGNTTYYVRYRNACGNTTCLSTVATNTVSIASAASTTAVCFSTASQNASLAYTATTGTPDKYSIVWDTAAVAAGLVNQTDTSFTFVATGGTLNTIAIPANVPAGTYTGTLTVKNGSSCVSFKNNFTITINPKPTVTNSSLTQTICSGGNSTLVTLTSGVAGTTFTWTASATAGVSGFTTSGTNTIPVQTISTTGTTQGTVTYVINPTANGCPGTSSVATFTITPLPTTSNAGIDQSGNSSSFTLAANTATIGTGAWSIASGPSMLLSQFSNISNPTATFTPAISGSYVLNWTISNTCGSSSDQVVISNCISNLISNGDFSNSSAGNNKAVNWTYATTFGIYVETNPENTYFSTGNTSGFTAELDSEASLRQMVTVVPGVSYTVSFLYGRRPGAPATTGVTVKITDGATTMVSPNLTTTSTTPQVGSFTFTPTGSSIGVEFYNTLHGNLTFGTIIDDIILIPTSQVVPRATTTPKGVFNTSTSCAGIPVQLDVDNVPASGITYAWTGSAGAVFSPSANIKNPTITFTGSGIQQATVTATSTGGCSMSSTTYVNVNALPTAYAVTGGGPYCSGGTGVLVGLANSASGVNYQLQIGGVNTGSVVAGTGSAISFGLKTATGSYTVVATNATTTCTSNMTGSVSITINPIPSAPTVGSVTNISCITNTGSIVLNGLPAGSWTINQSGSTVTSYSGNTSSYTVLGLSAGSYSFRVTNAGGCPSSATATIPVTDASSTTWNGTAWSNGTPDASKNAIIVSINPNSPFTTDLSACSLTINNSSGVVTIPSGVTLTITNELTVSTDYDLIFENNASLVQINNVTNTGKIIYKRTSSPMKNFDFTYWSSPVAGQTLFDLSPNTLFDKYFSFSGTSWQAIMNGSAVMQPGIGYIIRTPKGGTWPAPHPEVVNFPYSQPVQFIGVPNNGNITSSQSMIKDNFYLIGNPYPSSLQADEFLFTNSNNHNALNGTIYFWTHNTAISNLKYTSDDYASYNGLGGVATSGGPVPLGYIAAGQSFFGSAKANGNVEFNNSMRVAGNNTQFFKPGKTSKIAGLEKHRVWLNMTNTGGAFKQILIGYAEGATNAYDNDFDGLTFDGNSYIDLYSVNGTDNLVIQGRALPFKESDIVPLGYRSTIAGDFTIAINQADGALAGQRIYLEDKQTGTINELTAKNYTFSTKSGTFNNRFVLRYTNTTLGMGDFETVENGITVMSENKTITVNSTVETLDKVFIYDVSGKQLYKKQNIGNLQLSIQHLPFAQQVLLLKVVLENGNSITRKVILK